MGHLDRQVTDMQQWDEIHGFQSPGEYSRFVSWISEALEGGVLQEIPVGSRYAGATVFEEHWYRTGSGQIWRVVAPDYPFTGLFARVDKSE